MKALSFGFEGLFGTGKSKTIRLLFPNFNPSLERIWAGYGYHFSVRKAAEQSLTIEQWINKRDLFFTQIETQCDYLLLERCAFSDFSNLCFRKKLISPELLMNVNQWWPDWIFLINTSLATCVEQVRTRPMHTVGDELRANMLDMAEFEVSINKTMDFLKPLIGERIIVVPSPEEAYQRCLGLIAERRQL